MTLVAWITVVGAIVGIVGQWGVTAFLSGRVVERIDGHGRRMDVHERRVDELTERVDNHGERIARLEGRSQ